MDPPPPKKKCPDIDDVFCSQCGRELTLCICSYKRSDEPERSGSRTPEASNLRPPEASTSRTPEASSSKPPEASSLRPPEASTSRTPEASSSKPPEASSSRPPEASTSRTPEASTSRPPEAPTSRTPEASCSRKRRSDDLSTDYERSTFSYISAYGYPYYPGEVSGLEGVVSPELILNRENVPYSVLAQLQSQKEPRKSILKKRSRSEMSGDPGSPDADENSPKHVRFRFPGGLSTPPAIGLPNSEEIFYPRQPLPALHCNVAQPYCVGTRFPNPLGYDKVNNAIERIQTAMITRSSQNAQEWLHNVVTACSLNSPMNEINEARAVDLYEFSRECQNCYDPDENEDSVLNLDEAELVTGDIHGSSDEEEVSNDGENSAVEMENVPQEKDAVEESDVSKENDDGERKEAPEGNSFAEAENVPEQNGCVEHGITDVSDVTEGKCSDFEDDFIMMDIEDVNNAEVINDAPEERDLFEEILETDEEDEVNQDLETDDATAEVMRERVDNAIRMKNLLKLIEDAMIERIKIGNSNENEISAKEISLLNNVNDVVEFTHIAKKKGYLNFNNANNGSDYLKFMYRNMKTTINFILTALSSSKASDTDSTESTEEQVESDRNRNAAEPVLAERLFPWSPPSNDPATVARHNVEPETPLTYETYIGRELARENLVPGKFEEGECSHSSNKKIRHFARKLRYQKRQINKIVRKILKNKERLKRLVERYTLTGGDKELVKSIVLSWVETKRDI